MARASCDVSVYVRLSGYVWTDITSDVLKTDDLTVSSGIIGNKPTDCVASPGRAAFSLDNRARGASKPRGRYSPLHANVVTGWTYGIPCLIVAKPSFTSDAAITSMSRFLSLVTVTTTAAHGLTSGWFVTTSGASGVNVAEYNTTAEVTVTGASTFTFTLEGGTPAASATGTLLFRRTFPLHRGKIRTIAPESGVNSTKRVRVSSDDYMQELAEADIRHVEVQLAEDAQGLFDAILSGIDANAQPVATDFEAFGVTFDYALYKAKGIKALTAFKQVSVDAVALVWVNGFGTLRSIGPATRNAAAVSITLGDGDASVTVPSSLDGAYNVVTVVSHPPLVDTAERRLWTLVYASPIIRQGQTYSFYVDYNDDFSRAASEVTGQLLGAIDVDIDLTLTAANIQADGGGADITASFDFAITPYASSALIEVTNNFAADGYLIALAVKGKGLFDAGPYSFRSAVSKSYGVRPLTIDLTYQTDNEFIVDLADAISSQYANFTSTPLSVRVDAGRSDTLLGYCLVIQPGDLAQITETMVGLSASEAAVQSIAWTFSEGPRATCTLGLAPVVTWPT